VGQDTTYRILTVANNATVNANVGTLAFLRFFSGICSQKSLGNVLSSLSLGQKERQSMKIRKTRQDRRETYRYEVYLENDNGEYIDGCIELKPGNSGVTEAWIKTLHSLDDHEVYMNCKNGHPPLTEAEKTAKREWEKEHEGEVCTVGWNLSLDHIVSNNKEDVGKSSILKSASYMMEEEVPADVQHLRDIVETMTEKQQLVYRLHIIEGYSFTEIAKLMGTSVPNVKKHYDRVILHIKKNF